MKRSHLIVLACAVLAGCGGSVSDASPDGGTYGGADTAITTTDTGAPIDTGAPRDTAPALDAPPARDTGACNDLANLGAVVEETNVPAAMPRLAGAASIPSGTYVLVKDERYTGAGGSAGKTGHTLKETLLVDPGFVQSVVSQDGSPDAATSTAYAIVGSTLRITPTCGSSTAPTVEFMFDVSGSTFRIALSTSGLDLMLTFEKK